MSAVLDWSIDRAIADVVESGAFGPGTELASFEPDSQRTGQDQYASTVYFGTVAVRGREGNQRSYHLVFKLKHRIPELRKLIMTDKQFYNEILFYERLMPFLMTFAPPTGDLPSLARYFYGRNYCGDYILNDMIVLENASPRGYRLSEQRLFLDRDHIIVAMRTLAKLHGLSYRAKHTDPVRFVEMMADIKETHIHSNVDWVMPGGNFIISNLLSVALDRLEGRLVVDDNDGGSRLRRFREKFADGINRMCSRLVNPREPLATLCHGDFNRNNLLFRYDDAGLPVDVLVFDMATVRYGSPVLDLSFFLYMNTDRRLRHEHWDELLDAYCDALAETVSDVADAVRVPDRTQLDAEFREYGMYGLIHVSFFMRIMMETNNVVDPVPFTKLNDQDAFEMLRSFGGNTATDVIADAVQHYLDTYGAI